jgi:hypothetical protein
MTMTSDYVWNHFLMFCRRNGLLYGHAVDEIKPKTREPSHPSIAIKNEMMNLSSLERVLRRKPTG